MHLTAHDLYQGGVVEEVLPEPPGGAQTDWEATFRTVDAGAVAGAGAAAETERAKIGGEPLSPVPEVGTGKKGATMSAPEILSTGSCVPTQVVTNEMLAQRVDTSDEWVFSRTGIHSRRHCSGGENGVAMAAQAARQALERAGVKPEEVSVCLVATFTPILPVPPRPACSSGSWDCWKIPYVLI